MTHPTVPFSIDMITPMLTEMENSGDAFYQRGLHPYSAPGAAISRPGKNRLNTRINVI